MFIDATMSTQQNVVGLINLANGTDVAVSKIEVVDPVTIVPVEPSINNTEATVKARKGQGFSGQMKMRYRRPDITEVSLMPVRGFDVFRGMTPALLAPIAEASLGVPPGNVVVLPFSNLAPTVTIKARDDSLLIVGESIFELTWH